MDSTLNTVLEAQFGAALDMLGNAIQECPDSLWRERLWNHPKEQPGFSEFWYLAFHALFWLDFYLSGSVEGFAPPAPFTLSEFDATGFPDKIYSKDELQTYLAFCRKKCQITIQLLTIEKATQVCKFRWAELTFEELLLYNIRHVQEHAAQLNLILGQRGISVTGWVTQAKK